jgi:hypothetical protein
MASFLQGKDLVLLQFGRTVTSAITALPATTHANIFVISGGRVVITSLTGVVTVAVQAQANATKLISAPTTGSSNDMCATLDLNAAEAGALLSLDGVLATALQGAVNKSGSVGAMTKYQIANIGNIQVNCAATNTGNITWTMTYVPLDVGASVASA